MRNKSNSVELMVECEREIRHPGWHSYWVECRDESGLINSCLACTTDRPTIICVQNPVNRGRNRKIESRVHLFKRGAGVTRV